MSIRGMQPYFTVNQRYTVLDRKPDYTGPRYYGKYRGIVVDNKDPQNAGQLLVRVPAVHGDYDCGWAMPCTPVYLGDNLGLYMIPNINDVVWVEFEQGIPNYPIWVGGYFSPGKAPYYQTADNKRIALRTRNFTIIIDDGAEGDAFVEITDGTGNYIQLDSTNNKVVLEAGPGDGAHIILDGQNQKVIIKGTTTQVF